MALSFALLVCGAPYGTESAAQAYLFARELIVQGHTLKKVFFYQEGVLNANFLTSPASDEQNLVAAWVSLAREHAVELDVCVAAALRRGVLDGDEAYEFTWVGKKAAIVEANKPIRKTLRPCKEESVDFDTTENLYIEGDNLDVLKLLRETYLNRVKMIYIDIIIQKLIQFNYPKRCYG